MSKSKPKITIKPFKHQVQMDPDYAEKTWNLLKGAIREIHKQNASGLSFEELYRNAYNMVLHKYGDKLYTGLQSVVEEHLKHVSVGVADAVDDSFLDKLDKAWSDHKISMLMIRDILMYMDRVYVMNNNCLSVYDLGLKIFRETVARSARIKDRLLKTILELVKKERSSEPVQRGLLKNITQMLIDLGINSRSVYEDDFERPFLDESASFYRLESQEFITGNSCSDYMRKVEARLKEEVDRVKHYLDQSTEPKIRGVVEQELIANHLKTLIEMESSGMIFMLKEDKVEDLHRMFQLFGRVTTGHAQMREIMGGHVQDTGKGLIMDEEKQKDHLALVQTLLEMKDKYDRLLVSAFNNDKPFMQTLNTAFETFINLNPKSPEFISLFIDEKLKKGMKGANDEEVDVILDKVMMLFRFIQEKDVFEKYYKQHLARRLLLGRSVSDDAERSMIGKLKTECGYQFTSKLEGMFTDMKLSADTMDNFRAFLRNERESPLGSVDLTVSVLTTGYWPTQNVGSCNLPAEILKCCEVFKNFYLKAHNGRRLTWQTNMGTADLKAAFQAKKHELTVSTYQMVLLLLFNDRTELSFKELRDMTGISAPDLKRSLMALINPKHRILTRAAAGSSGADKGTGGGEGDRRAAGPVGSIDDADVFAWNGKFKSNLTKVKVLMVQQKETEPERQETREKVDEDRKHIYPTQLTIHAFICSLCVCHQQLAGRMCVWVVDAC
eukprot:TRINITY_DN3623_c0_g1_i1.p1 TRINITY_DN3623_c0_g1~~TRINITY_DN3623_c0_g1_i1.p1  ORF type:complete len:724 (-),score=229.24 TRINITY_DN3623_c0_g1_i1:473-2644(-)